MGSGPDGVCSAWGIGFLVFINSPFFFSSFRPLYLSSCPSPSAITSSLFSSSYYAVAISPLRFLLHITFIAFYFHHSSFTIFSPVATFTSIPLFYTPFLQPHTPTPSIWAHTHTHSSLYLGQTWPSVGTRRCPPTSTAQVSLINNKRNAQTRL